MYIHEQSYDKNKKCDNIHLGRFYKLFNYNKHVAMKVCTVMSGVLLIGAFSLLMFVPGEVASFFNHKVFSARWLSVILGAFHYIAEFIVEKNIQIIVTIICALASGLVILINGEKRLIILQVKTLFYNPVIWIWTVFFTISLFIDLVSILSGRVIIAFLSFLSCCLYGVYILFFLIRINNDRNYFNREICALILKFYDKTSGQLPHYRNKKIKKIVDSFRQVREFFLKKLHNYSNINRFITWLKDKLKNYRNKRYRKYVEYVFPTISDKQNKIKNDVGLIEYLLINMKLPGEKKEYNQYEDCLTLIDDFFCSVLVFLVAHLRRTYRDQNAELLVQFVNGMQNIHWNSQRYNLILHCFTVMVLREHIIKQPQISVLEKDKENVDYIKSFLLEHENHFAKVYGNMIGKNRKAIVDSWDVQCYDMYSVLTKMYRAYIECLNDIQFINITSYIVLEHEYMSGNKILQSEYVYGDASDNYAYYDDYNIFDILFVDVKRREWI